MTDRVFTRQVDGGVLEASHINELQEALETDDVRITSIDETLGVVDTRVGTLEDATAKILLGTCDTNAVLPNKTLTLASPFQSYVPVKGDMFLVTYTLGQQSGNVTLNINGAGTFPIRVGNTSANEVGHTTTAGGVLLYSFDGAAYHLVGSQQQVNTTYSEISQIEIEQGTGTTPRTISGQRAKNIIDSARTSVPAPVQATDAANKEYVDAADFSVFESGSVIPIVAGASWSELGKSTDYTIRHVATTRSFTLPAGRWRLTGMFGCNLRQTHAAGGDLAVSISVNGGAPFSEGSVRTYLQGDSGTTGNDWTNVVGMLPGATFTIADTLTIQVLVKTGNAGTLYWSSPYINLLAWRVS